LVAGVWGVIREGVLISNRTSLVNKVGGVGGVGVAV
jgi:hypothetical protein